MQFRIVLLMFQPSNAGGSLPPAGFDLGQRLRSGSCFAPAGLYFGGAAAARPVMIVKQD
jgi:hypothetical protein